MQRAFSVTLGSVALLATIAIIGVLIVLSIHVPQASGRTTSQVSVGVEVAVFACLAWLVATYASPSVRYWSRRSLRVDQGLCLLAITFATVAVVATLIQFSKAPVDHSDSILGANKNNFLTGSSIALGLSFAFQSIFLLFHFIISRTSDQAQSLHSMEEERKSPAARVKTIRYSQTSPDPDLASRLNSMTSQHTLSSSIGGRSRSGTMTSIKSSLSHAIRPVTSKTQLLSNKETRRPASMDSYAHRTSGDDAFDTWDTSSVDTQNRQVVLEVSTPPQTHGRFLETIPGSPTVSRTPSPNTEAMPFQPPRIRPRSRSYSPAPRRREQSSPIPEPPPSMSELHIHPLFRSGSPDPPPVTTPGTVVIASPNAGQVITHRQSVRSLNQTRVSSNPLFSSPLSTRDSTVRDEQSVISITEEETDLETEPTPTPSERTMTPPIPEWVLGAGTRSSWTGYNTRKSKTWTTADANM
ncbi:hypothetical protein EDB81DRAFT_837282 [Dactylonectria macrodidyma]|uniref:Uncharacterized protein n=1 Tax=Dactylonectria macrodidyma TaxID=307937 RepID=A0A9P9FR74_9HYPO|nr:hypothetical protein EDB81DRAFT_837282 [Dactylonectria macrodidyma]